MQEFGKPVDVKLLDFQACRSGTVVSDLAYLIYSGATKEVYGNLDHFLKIYHDSFADTLRSYNLDTSKIFTLDDLKSEWKDHCAIGFLLSALLWGNKLSKCYEKRNFFELEQSGTLAVETGIDTYETDVDKLHTIFVDLVEHMNENNWL